MAIVYRAVLFAQPYNFVLFFSVMKPIIDDIQRILEMAIHASSGENCQSWRFEIRDDEIRILIFQEEISRSIIMDRWRHMSCMER